MPSWFWAINGSMLLIMLILTWLMLASKIAMKKRQELIDRWTICGDHSLGIDEYETVEYGSHMWRVFTLRSAKPLYGPLMQGVWEYNIGMQYNDFWWRCYNELYLRMFGSYHRTWINRLMAKKGYDLVKAMIYIGQSPYDILEDITPPQPIFSMTDGAEEYDQIMAAQELMP